MLKEILLVGAGGFAGSVSRYLVSSVMTGAGLFYGFPLGTFTVNVMGSFIAGLVVALSSGEMCLLMCMAGFCGGFTTFSALSVETLAMLKEGRWAWGAMYVAATVTMGLLAVWGGWAVGGRIR